MIKYDLLDIEYCKKEYPILWNTYRAAFGSLPDHDIALAVSIAVSTCPHCYEENRYVCVCWRDE